MTNFNEAAGSDEILERESLAWVNRLLSGAVTPEDAEALTAWRTQSPAHEQMFVEAVRFQRRLRKAILAQRSELRAPAAASPLHRLESRRRINLGRRALLGGSLAAAVGGYMVVRPSLASLMSDYRTGTGERRTIAAAPGVSLELNTQTNIDVRSSAKLPGIELLSGEAEVSGQRSPTEPFSVIADGGRTLVAQGKINVRNIGSSVCVTCIEGYADIRHRRGNIRIEAGRQVIYTGRALSEPVAANLLLVTGWRKGLLIFRDEPLQHVIDELNRYRPGRIVLMDAALARRPVYGVFQISQIGRAVEQVQRLTGARATHLPGDIVVLS